MSLDQVFSDVKAALFSLRSKSAITNEQNIFACEELEKLRLKTHELNSSAEKKLPSAAEFLTAGVQHMQDRARTYDNADGERSIWKTVEAFNVITDRNLTEEEGWLFMGLLKKVRSMQGDYRADNYEDDAAYAGLRGECAARTRQ